MGDLWLLVFFVHEARRWRTKEGRFDIYNYRYTLRHVVSPTRSSCGKNSSYEIKEGREAVQIVVFVGWTEGEIKAGSGGK